MGYNLPVNNHKECTRDKPEDYTATYRKKGKVLMLGKMGNARKTHLRDGFLFLSSPLFGKRRNFL